MEPLDAVPIRAFSWGAVGLLVLLVMVVMAGLIHGGERTRRLIVFALLGSGAFVLLAAIIMLERRGVEIARVSIPETIEVMPQRLEPDSSPGVVVTPADAERAARRAEALMRQREAAAEQWRDARVSRQKLDLVWAAATMALILATVLGLIFGGDRARRAILISLGVVGVMVLMIFGIKVVSVESSVATRVETYHLLDEPSEPSMGGSSIAQEIPLSKLPAAKAPDTKKKASDTKPTAKPAPAIAPAAPAPTPLDAAAFERERQKIELQWRDDQVGRRLWHLSSIAGLTLVVVASALAYLKVNLKTGGRYRRHLRLAAGAAILASTALAAYGWNMPWRS